MPQTNPSASDVTRVKVNMTTLANILRTYWRFQSLGGLRDYGKKWHTVEVWVDGDQRPAVTTVLLQHKATGEYYEGQVYLVDYGYNGFLAHKGEDEDKPYVRFTLAMPGKGVTGEYLAKHLNT